MDAVLGVCIGIALAATCGFRLFIPLLALSIAGTAGLIDLGSGFHWLGTWPSIVVFGAATVAEILAYFIPIIDNILDAASVPFSVMAGVVAAAASMTDVSPFLQWSLAIIAGGGAAAAASLVSNGVHAASTLTTGGAANPAVSAVESTGSVVASVLAIVVPIAAVVLIATAIAAIYGYVVKAKRKAAADSGGGEGEPAT